MEEEESHRSDDDWRDYTRDCIAGLVRQLERKFGIVGGGESATVGIFGGNLGNSPNYIIIIIRISIFVFFY